MNDVSSASNKRVADQIGGYDTVAREEESDRRRQCSEIAVAYKNTIRACTVTISLAANGQTTASVHLFGILYEIKNKKIIITTVNYVFIVS